MRKWAWVVVVVLLVGGGWWWAQRDVAAPVVAESMQPAQAVTEPMQLASKWTAPVTSRGTRAVRGVVTREGEPVAGVQVTAVAAHGQEVLSDLPCRCDNQCGQKLLACGCPEASGQLVELLASRSGEGVPLGRAVTNEKGEFSLEGLDDTALTLWADSSNTVAWKTDVVPSEERVTLPLERGQFVAGKVMRFDGKPAVAALVTAIFAKQSRFFEVLTDATGAFRVGPIPQGTVAVVAVQTGLLPDHQTVREDAPGDLSLELSVPRTISGTVVRDGQPVSGIAVKLEGMHRKRIVTTDAQGRFSGDSLRPGPYTLSAQTPTELATAKTQLGKYEDRGGVVLELKQGMVLSGLVTDVRGAPLAEVAVSADDARAVSTDAEGRFTLTPLPEGSHRIWAVKKRYLTGRLETTGGQSLHFTLQDAAHLTGRVVAPDGTLVQTFEVYAELGLDGGVSLDEDGEWQAGHSDAEKSSDGGFELDLVPGVFDVSVRAPPWAPTHVRATAPGDVTVRVTPGAGLTGRVLDLDGVPVSEARVSLRSAASDGNEHTKTGADGQFKLSGLSAGVWRVSAMAFSGKEPSFSVAAEVTLVAGASRDVQLQPRPGAPVAGVVVSTEGEPMPNVRVFAWNANTDGGSGFEGMGAATTDEHGAFRLRTLRPGPFTLTAEQKGVESATQKGSAPDEKVIVRLGTSTTVVGRVVDEQGNPLRVFSFMHRPLDTTDGRFEQPSPVGKRSFGVDAEGFAQKVFSFDVKPGRNDLGDVRMSRGRVVTGVVTEAGSNKPIEGALVDVGDAMPEGTPMLSEQMGAARTNAEGRYSLRVDPASSFIMASHPEAVFAAQALAPDARTADFALSKGAAVTVRVFDAQGVAVSQARVAMSSPSGDWKFLRPAEAGVFRVAGVAPGKWTVVVQGVPPHLWRPRQVEVAAAPVELEFPEATDGVTVKLIVADSEQLVLVPGEVAAPTDARGLAAMAAGQRADKGVVARVLPGRYTAMAFKVDGSESLVLAQPLTVSSDAEQTFTLAGTWAEFRPR